MGRESAGDIMHQKHTEDLGDFEKVSGVENETPNKKGRLSGLAEARQICALWVPHEIGGEQMEKPE